METLQEKIISLELTKPDETTVVNGNNTEKSNIDVNIVQEVGEQENEEEDEEPVTPTTPTAGGGDDSNASTGKKKKRKRSKKGKHN